MLRVMNPADRRKWTKALRSGNYKQAEGALRRVTTDYVGDMFNPTPVETTAYCCLGVAQSILGSCEPRQNHSMLRSGRFGLSRSLQSALAVANDDADRVTLRAAFRKAGYKTTPRRRNGSHCTFKEIADWIDANL